MALPVPIEARLARLAPDQRAAATAPPGPVLCLAPAGSGKTTTLVARVAWLAATGHDPSSIAAIAFNRGAADELAARLDSALAPLDVAPATVRVRTFHGLGREILRDAGESVEPLVDRLTVLRELRPDMGGAALRELDAAISRLKLEHGVDPRVVADDPARGPLGDLFLAYETLLAGSGGLDFDDLVVRALRRLEADPVLVGRWRARCADLLVDEVQDVDRGQLRLALLLAAPADRIFLVGDDDQSIYGWRLADVRRVIGLASMLPGLRRFDLEVNYRCPAPVVERSVRLVEHNAERFTKRIRPRSGASGRLILAGDGAEDVIRVGRALDRSPIGDGTCAVLARTNRELLPAMAAAMARDRPFRAPGIRSLAEDPRVPAAMAMLPALPGTALLPRLARLRALPEPPSPEQASASDTLADLDDEAPPWPTLVAAMLGWAAAHATAEAFVAAVDAARSRLARLRRDDAELTLATAHSTKGTEFDHVVVMGLDAGRFPNARSVSTASDPVRALEEERRLAYVAWTRARRSLTLLYDPAAPSSFILEAFTAEELGIEATSAG